MGLLTGANTDEPAPTWELLSFTVNHDFKLSGLFRFYLDRGNDEMGIILANSPATIALAQFKDNEGIYFQLKSARAASWRAKCRKISLLFQQLQLDVDFASFEQARAFLNDVEAIMMRLGNHYFSTYEAPSNAVFMRDFDMVEHGHIGRANQTWMAVPADSEWPRLRKTGEWSDFTITAGNKLFAAHRVKLCKESHYFNAICTGAFAESTKRSIELPESADTVSALLDEMYDTYNSTTGSIFTNFALCHEMEKERIMGQLLELFIASDKYTVEKVKRKVTDAIIDRLPFIKDSLVIVDIAGNIFHDRFPPMDCGLRQAIIVQIDARMRTIIEDQGTWEEYSGNKAVIKAVHMHQCEMREVKQE